MNKAHLLTEKLALQEDYNQGKVSYDDFQQRLRKIQELLKQENPKK
ncbi:hypothetical protein ACFOLK_09405 [Marinococcus halophilus]|uniref:Uncharacterized protein n=1 Tax=Marinococcus halophilus TaxID=1371 RepID=A0A510Y4E5_MARHA|nr:hypothetical protein [Marinococcus halophilus]GEK58216.1 hypothetical protein MHA01_11210 [Marinococcus halophilus]